MKKPDEGIKEKTNQDQNKDLEKSTKPLMSKIKNKLKKLGIFSGILTLLGFFFNENLSHLISNYYVKKNKVGNLEILSNLDSVDVLLNNDTIGLIVNKKLRKEDIRSGNYELLLTKVGYEPFKEKIEIKEGELNTKQVFLIKSEKLKFYIDKTLNPRNITIKPFSSNSGQIKPINVIYNQQRLNSKIQPLAGPIWKFNLLNYVDKDKIFYKRPQNLIIFFDNDHQKDTLKIIFQNSIIIKICGVILLKNSNSPPTKQVTFNSKILTLDEKGFFSIKMEFNTKEEFPESYLITYLGNDFEIAHRKNNIKTIINSEFYSEYKIKENILLE